MKIYRKILAAAAALLTLGLAYSCSDKWEEITDINLSRCLQPMGLSAKINQGQNVTFGWKITMDAESYTLAVYSDAEMTQEVFSEEVKPSEVPVTKYLDVDQSFWFRVQAHNPVKEDSKWAVYGKAIKTFAVKPCLYMKLEDRAANSLSFSWNIDPEVERIECAESGSEAEPLVYMLTDADKESGTATVPGLKPSTEYDAILYFSSANRGEVNAWTKPSTDGLTSVSTSAALEQALKDGAKILLTMDGSPYTIGSADVAKGMDLDKGVEIYGEGAGDGSLPVVYGDFNLTDAFTGSIYAEGVEFNGQGETCGFLIQHKEGSANNDLEIGSIIFRNCVITGYSKGLFYEWGKTMKIGEFTFDSCDIHAVNEKGAGGGDGFDLRNATSIEKLNFVNNTIYNGFRTFLRIDANPVIGDVVFENNTVMNICFVKNNPNNGGIFGFQTAPKSFSLKRNLFLNMPAESIMTNVATKYLAGDKLNLSAAENWFFGVNENFFNTNFTQAMAAGSILEKDPCYNAKGGQFNINGSSDIAGKKIGASKWWAEYIEEPEDLTMIKVEGSHTWDFTDARYFASDFTKSKVRDMLLFGVNQNKITAADGIIGFTSAATTTKKGVPTDGYLAFLVDQPGSVVIKPLDPKGTGNHFTVGVGPVSGTTISIKGGAAALADMGNAQKILVKDITEETLVYIFPCGPVSLEQLAWSTDVNAVNTALPTPEPVAKPGTVTAGEAEDVLISWNPVDNAGSYSVVFSGKSYPVEEGCEYTIASSVVGMLDAGSYKVEVYANPAKNDIYNTMSAAGVATFAVQPKGGDEPSDEFVVSSVEELLNAIDAGKDAITLKYSDTPYEIGALTITTPLHLKGQTSGDKKTAIKANITLSGEIGGSVVFDNLDITNEVVSVITEDKVGTAPVADTVAVTNCYIHGTKALYDNSGKVASDVQVLIFKGNVINGCSDGADFIDLRNGAHHTVSIVDNTFANSCRTFLRTDATHELNYLTVRNNTFYKVATNAGNKDNNGIFHVRSAAGAGLLSYKVISNLFYSILIDTDPKNAAGFPKFRSKTGIDPQTVANNYFYNCEEREEKAAYSFWAYFSKDAATVGGGAILPADPCKDAANGDFTLINGVAMNANVGDPRWNSIRGSQPASDITVNNTDEFLTAISAGKSTITLAAGQYDLTAVADVAEVANGKLTITNSLNLIGQNGAEFIGGFMFKEGVTSFTASNLSFNGNSAVDNVFEVVDATVSMSKFSVRNSVIKDYKNRLFYMGQDATVASIEFCRNIISGKSGADFTSGDFIDIRKGTVTAIQFHNNTVSNAVRTFARIDATVVLNSMLVLNNTFYNMCYVDNKDNNGIFHVKATSVDESALIVRNNIFAGMHRAAETPTNKAGYPKLVSTNTESKIPTFRHNYFNDIDTLSTGYNFWTKDRVTEELATAGYGIVLAESPFKDAAKGDFTLVNALAASEKVGDPRWNPNGTRYDGVPFEVADVDAMLTAIAAGKSELLLTGKEYDLTAVEGNEAVASGVLTVANGLKLAGKLSHGVKPHVKAAFTISATEGSVVLENLKLDGASTLSDMIVIAADANLSALNIRNCEISAYKNRMVSGPNESVTSSLLVQGNIVTDMGTGGDFIDFRKGTLKGVKVVGNTFANGIRTFFRCDKIVICNAVNIENNTFYNLGAVDNKDNNGILHVRSTTATSNPRQIVVKKNIFAGMHRAEETPKNTAAGFPHLISKLSADIAVPTITDNIFFDIDDDPAYGWWMYLPETAASAKSTVVAETPFAADPATGKFTVKTQYKGYGDLRW